MLYIISTNDLRTGDGNVIRVLESSTGIVTDYTRDDIEKMVLNNIQIPGARIKSKYSYKEEQILRKALNKEPKLLEEKLKETELDIDSVYKLDENDEYLLVACSERIFKDKDSDDHICGSNFGYTGVYLFKKDGDKLVKFMRLVKLNDYQGYDQINFEESEDQDDNFMLHVDSDEIDIEEGRNSSGGYRIYISLCDNELLLQLEIGWNFDSKDYSLSEKDLKAKMDTIGQNISDY